MIFNVNKERLLNYFIDLVKISSPSWKEKGVIDYIVRTLGRKGLTLNKYKCGESDNLLVCLKGNAPKTPVMFSAHMDTVIPCEHVNPVITDTRIMSDGRTILGSDDKAAIAAFLEAIAVIRENGMTHGPVEFLFSCAEETGLHGIKGFDLSLLNARYAFVFDSDGKPGKVMVRAPYQSNMDIAVKGRAAHAGIAPEKGISAIRVISEIVSSIPHGRIDEETTTNVGLISGGKATNIVAEDASIALEARSIDLKKLRSVEKEIENIARVIARNCRAKIKVNKKLEYSGYRIRENDNIIRIIDKAMKKIKMRPKYMVSGGGSDTNIINQAGIKAVNLSIGMQEVHTTREYINIKDLFDGTRLVLSLIDTV